MSERWLGMVVSGGSISAVDAEVSDTGPIVVQAVHDWRMQKGDRPHAYALLHQIVGDYLREHGVKRVVMKASGGSGKGGATNALLYSAELRGVVLASSSSAGVIINQINKASASKTFGERKISEYISDDDFWDGSISGADVKKGAREAAMQLLIQREAK